jgi:hypothetical protein
VLQVIRATPVLRVNELTFRIVDVSNISAMKVEIPLSWLSPAPTRHKTESKIGNWASEQGTNEPICAMSAITPTYSRYEHSGNDIRRIRNVLGGCMCSSHPY